MPWYDKAQMLAILSNHTVTHHYTAAEFCAAMDKHIREQAAPAGGQLWAGNDSREPSGVP